MDRFFWGFNGLVAVIYAVLPVAWIISLSLKRPADLNDRRFFPTSVSFDNYQAIFPMPSFRRPYGIP